MKFNTLKDKISALKLGEEMDIYDCRLDKKNNKLNRGNQVSLMFS